MNATDRFDSFLELARHRRAGVDYRVRAVERASAAALIVAPHGGEIEVGTSEIARLLAGREHSLFCFEALHPCATRHELHVTSHRFDHPQCLTLASRARVAIAIHGCVGESHVYVGGLDRDLGALLARHLRAAGFRTSENGHRYPGRHPHNICNRTASGRGAQLEITHDWRRPPLRALLARAARAALDEYLAIAVD